MFFSNSAFNQPIGDWELNTGVFLNNFASSSAFSPENYARTLIGWANDILVKGNCLLLSSNWGILSSKTLSVTVLFLSLIVMVVII